MKLLKSILTAVALLTLIAGWRISNHVAELDDLTRDETALSESIKSFDNDMKSKQTEILEDFRNRSNELTASLETMCGSREKCLAECANPRWHKTIALGLDTVVAHLQLEKQTMDEAIRQYDRQFNGEVSEQLAKLRNLSGPLDTREKNLGDGWIRNIMKKSSWIASYEGSLQSSINLRRTRISGLADWLPNPNRHGKSLMESDVSNTLSAMKAIVNLTEAQIGSITLTDVSCHRADRYFP